VPLLHHLTRRAFETAVLQVQQRILTTILTTPLGKSFELAAAL
jgi:hypothetical protein